MKTNQNFSNGLMIIFLTITGLCYAQSDLKPPVQSSQFSAGISLGHYRYDPGVAVEVTTPAFLKDNLSLRFRTSVQWLEEYKSVYDHWASYNTYNLGLVYYAQIVDRTRFYSEVGMLSIIPDIKFSDEVSLEGFYILNGLEILLFTKPDFSMALSLAIGPSFIEAYADKIEGRPRYGSGLSYITGVRAYFGNMKE